MCELGKSKLGSVTVTPPSTLLHTGRCRVAEVEVEVEVELCLGKVPICACEAGYVSTTYNGH